jgi:hypothetical protein
MDSYKILQQHSATGIQKNHKYSQTRAKLTMLLLWEDGHEMS